MIVPENARPFSIESDAMAYSEYVDFAKSQKSPV
jgi:hypothetical protein